MVLYDLKKEEIPDLVDNIMEFTTASEIDQGRIARDFVKNLTRKHREHFKTVLREEGYFTKKGLGGV